MSQKFKEIEVWALPDIGKGNNDIVYFRLPPHDAIKCTLLVPVEEKKVTISESEFDEMWLSTPSPLSEPCHETVKRFKQKLFSENGG